MAEARTSRLSGFYQKSVAARVAILTEYADLDTTEVAQLTAALTLEQADQMVENVVGLYALPLGIGANFLINGRDYLIPMVVEEPSVVAAVSYAARLARHGEGFQSGSTDPVMIAQIQLLDVPDLGAACAALRAAKAALLATANTSPTIARLGGGPLDLELRTLPETSVGPMLIVHLLFDTRDAMGANAVNTAAETLAPRLEQLSGGRALLRILSNLADRRRAWAEVAIPLRVLGTPDIGGDAVGQAIAAANAFAVADPYRAATHNKGIMNGIDAVALATGNDWRGLEAGAHAYAAQSGQYRALTDWHVDEARDVLAGRLELPMAVGTVGGATRAHPLAQVCLKILGVTNARELGEVMAAVGLAQNLAALRALATDGIQRGHMALHARQMAIAAGAVGAEVDRVAVQLVNAGEIRVARAAELLAQERAQSQQSPSAGHANRVNRVN